MVTLILTKELIALNVQIICDDTGKIVYYYGGWPGSTYDNCAWRSCKIYINGSAYFDEGEYLLADSAWQYIVQSFKKLSGESVLSQQKEGFNTSLGQVRVKSEHCIGILKNRFPTFKRISAIIKGPKSIRRVLQLFSCAVILHNMLLETNKPIPLERMEMKEIEEQHE